MTRLPIESVLVWAAASVGAGARVVDVEALHDRPGPWWLRIERDGTIQNAVLRIGDRHSPQLAAVAAALRFAAEHAVAAPRLLASDLHGETLGVAAILETALPGNSAVPPTVTSARLREAGADACDSREVGGLTGWSRSRFGRGGDGPQTVAHQREHLRDDAGRRNPGHDPPCLGNAARIDEAVVTAQPTSFLLGRARLLRARHQAVLFEAGHDRVDRAGAQAERRRDPEAVYLANRVDLPAGQQEHHHELGRDWCSAQASRQHRRVICGSSLNFGMH